jgi:hypothetical protein
LLYDNASTNASCSEIQPTIAAVPGIETAVVVSWPYQFGPQGGPQRIRDSDYSQYGTLEHARHRFLSSARAVLQGDVDELVLTEGGVSVFDLATKSGTGYIRYGGHWVESATATPPAPATRCHKQYFYRAIAPTHEVREKWTAVPRRCPPSSQWCVHDVTCMSPDPSASARPSIRHFKAINTNWNHNRWQPEPIDRQGTDAMKSSRIGSASSTSPRRPRAPTDCKGMSRSSIRLQYPVSGGTNAPEQWSQQSQGRGSPACASITIGMPISI